VSLTPSTRFNFDFGWTLLDQDIKAATCLPLPTDAFPFTNPIALGSPAALNCRTASAITGSTSWSSSFPRAVLLDYQEETNTFYALGSFSPIKRVTLSFGYEVTGDNGRTNWLRGDTGQNLQVVGDVFGNVPYIADNLVGGANAVALGVTGCPPTASATSVATATGTGTGCLFAGPFPDQPLGPQAINWHKASAGIAFEVAKGFQFRGLWSYYDYNSKEEVQGGLRVVTPRDFHANVGTVSLKYSF
jgi:hypothetical protein